MKYWVENDGCYELHFEEFGADNVILKFVQDTDDKTCFWYVSEELNNPQGDYEFYDGIEEAKEEFESMYEDHLKSQIDYYEDLLEQWNDTDS